MELTERKKQILKIVVEYYVKTAEPVGSRTIARHMNGRISAATIRNELSDLTEMGCIEQPHTSAGRVPTPQGYRLYVDELMEQRRLSAQENQEIQDALRIRLRELDKIITRAGQAAAAYLNYPAYVSAAGKSPLTARRFDLLPVDESGCIAVIMLSNHRVKSQLFRFALPLEPDEILILANILNANFTGASAVEMDRRLMALTNQISPPAFLILSQIISYAGDLLEEQQRRIVTAGARELLKFPEFRDAEKAHELMGVLSDEKESLPAPDESGAIRILIGPENVADVLKNTSVVVASYDIGEDMRGLIGVVGPTRMDYAEVIARLTGFAEGLSRLFGSPALPPREEKSES